MVTSSPPTSSDPASYSVTALDAGLQVLRAIGANPDQTVPQLAKLMGMTKSKVFRIARTLEAQGFIYQAKDHTLRLGSAMLILGKQAESQYTLTRAAAPSLDILERETRENIYLVIREGTHGLVLDLRHSSHPVRTFARLGAVTPLTAGGAGKVLLAYAPPEIVEQVLGQPLQRYATNTITDPAILRPLLTEIQHEQFHVFLSDLQEHVFALAVPIFGHQGEVVAALSIAGPMLRFDEERLSHYGALLREAGWEVSQRLGSEILNS